MLEHPYPGGGTDACEGRRSVRASINIAQAVHTAIAARINPAAHHKITPEAKLTDLGIGLIDRAFSIPVDLEEALGLDEFTEEEIMGWATVGDVVAAARGKVGASHG